MEAVALAKKVMVEFGTFRKCQKCTDFTQFVPFLALLRTALIEDTQETELQQVVLNKLSKRYCYFCY